MFIQRLTIAAIGLAGLGGCIDNSGYQPAASLRTSPQTQAEINFVTSLLSGLQARSIAENREYCGVIGLTPNGRLIASVAQPGLRNRCWPTKLPGHIKILASYHTHGAHDPEYNSEFPSVTDLEADIHDGVNGYIGTPGGRVWYNDARQQTTMVLCGPGCIAYDPSYSSASHQPIAPRYSLQGLKNAVDG